MYLNGLTCKGINSCKIPCAFPNDRMAIQAAITLCDDSNGHDPFIIRIRNTQSLKEIQISENYLMEINTHPQIQVIGTAMPLLFDSFGNLPI